MVACEGLCEYLVKDKYNIFCPATPLRHDPKEYDITAGKVIRHLRIPFRLFLGEYFLSYKKEIFIHMQVKLILI